MYYLFYYRAMTMRRLVFVTDSHSTSTSDPPSPYSLPLSTLAPPSSPASPAPSSCSPSPPSSSSETRRIEELSEIFARMNVNQTRFLKDYCSAEPFELEAQEWGKLYFEGQTPTFQVTGSTAHLRSCLKKQPVSFLVQNSSTVKCVRAPAGIPLPTFLLMENIRSCIVLDSSTNLFPEKE